jgi:hypothetical protein
MSLSDLASLGSLVSGIAVLVSLIYLALQVQQAEKNQRALMQQGRATLFADVQLRLAEPTLAAVYVKGVRGEDLSLVEFNQFRFATRSLLAAAENAFYQHEERLLAVRPFNAVALGLRSAMALPGRRAMWRIERGRYEGTFQAFVDGMLEDGRASSLSDELAQWRNASKVELGDN